MSSGTDLAPARGVINGLALSALLWALLIGAAWAIARWL